MNYVQKIILPVFFLAGFSVLSAQTERPGPEPTAYSASTTIEGEDLQRFDASFSEQNVGFFHVYADPAVDPMETYLLRGTEMDDTALGLLPKKFKKKAARMGATVYGAGAIRGMNENMYLVRMDGDTEDRVEMFAIRGQNVRHLKTLAVMKKTGSRTKQVDSYITDIDGDAYLDLITVTKKRDGTIGKRRVYVLDRTDREWARTKMLDAPWDSVELFDPTME
ncbi:hypothetical protein [Neolewinella antarctica]|uniref:Uncharacterized protein n=1 Tax=Neolewinella antarctica TaxID=442734 RepID=A0ABX0X7D4_9BACT|nr:hypothetical protein [Neolewinella antarctica]NJC25106.1 hypothetical protein [Neolewinella antarctica]